MNVCPRHIRALAESVVVGGGHGYGFAEEGVSELKPTEGAGICQGSRAGDCMIGEGSGDTEGEKLVVRLFGALLSVTSCL